MTKKLIIVIGAILVLALNALFLVILVAADLFKEWRERGKW